MVKIGMQLFSNSCVFELSYATNHSNRCNLLATWKQ